VTSFPYGRTTLARHSSDELGLLATGRSRVHTSSVTGHEDRSDVSTMTRETTCHRVELYGLPAVIAGRRTLEVAGTTLAELASALVVACPRLAGPVIDPATGWLNRGYVFVVDGRFTRDPATALESASEILLVAAQAGG
jgi:molybdopterin converting factor small subunit